MRSTAAMAAIELIDAGGGREYSIRRIEQNLRDDGLDPANIKHVLLTHWHKDHAGGAHIWQQKYHRRGGWLIVLAKAGGK